MLFDRETIRYSGKSGILPRVSFSGYYRLRLFSQLVELEDAPYFTGRSKNDILEAVKKSELTLCNNRRFLATNLAAWVESKRPADIPFFKYGVSADIPTISESNISMIKEIAREAVELGRIGTQVHQLDSYGRIHIERIRDLHHISELDSFIINWTEMHKFCRSIFQKPFHVCNLAFVFSHPYVPNMTTHVDPQWLINKNRVDPALIVGINITDAALSDGGAHYKLGSHKTSGNDYSRPIDSSFTSKPTHPGAVYVHNTGTLHGCYPNVSEHTRLNLYISVLSLDEMKLKTSVAKVNEKYIFE